MPGAAASILASLAAVALYIGSLLILRLTSLTGWPFFLAAFGLTIGLGALGWAVVTLLERHRARRVRP